MEHQLVLVIYQGFPRGGANSWVWIENLLFCMVFSKTAWKWKKIDQKNGPTFDLPMSMFKDPLATTS